MRYIDRMDYRGICSYADKCTNTECFHRTDHYHYPWGSAFAGGPWSCVQQEHKCPYGETDDLIICNRTDNKKIHSAEKNE